MLENLTPHVNIEQKSTRRVELRSHHRALIKAGAVEGEEGEGLAVGEDGLRSVLAHGGAELEAVAGAAAEQEDAIDRIDNFYAALALT
jgi:hypothetical protein